MSLDLIRRTAAKRIPTLTRTRLVLSNSGTVEEAFVVLVVVVVVVPPPEIAAEVLVLTSATFVIMT